MNRLALALVAAAIVVPSGCSLIDDEASASESRIEDESIRGVSGGGAAIDAAQRIDNQSGIQSRQVGVALGAELQGVLDLTNAARAEANLAPLRYDSLLAEAAQAHSIDQAEMGQLTHTGSDGSDPGQRIDRTGYSSRSWAENAAAGFPTAESVMNGWMNSPGHRDNILRASVTEIGLGLAYTSDGYPYWTQVFAAPR